MVNIQVGQTGVFGLAPPFSDSITSNCIQTCTAIRGIVQCELSGEDIKNGVYIDRGLSLADYEKDKSGAVPIVSLYTKGGGWTLVPLNRILTEPAINGIPYHTLTLAAGLGPIETNADLSHLSDSVADVIYQVIGIRPDIQYAQTSDPFVVDFDEHDRITVMRRNKISVTKTNLGNLLETRKLLEDALSKIAVLEEALIKLTKK